MKPLPLFLIAASLGAAAQARADKPVRDARPAPAACMLSAAFGSYAMGIDMPAYRAARQLLDGDRGVRDIAEHRWGREGEITICARTRSRAAAERLFRAIRAAIPARPRGPVSLRTRSGLRFDAPARN